MKVLIISFFMIFNVSANDGITSYTSSYSFVETVEVVKSFIVKKKLTLFAIVDHSANAQSVGKNLNPTTLFIFGNPKVGTPLMQEKRSIGIDLPVKLLIYETSEKDVVVNYNDPIFLAKRHGIKENHESFKKMKNVLTLIMKQLEKSK